MKTSSVHEWDYQDDSYPSLASDPCCFQVSLPSTSWEPTMLKFHFFLSQDITMVLKKQKKNWAVCSLISRVSFCCKPTVLLITWVYEFPIPKFHEFFTNFVTKKQRFKRNQKATSFGYFVFHVRTL